MFIWSNQLSFPSFAKPDTPICSGARRKDTDQEPMAYHAMPSEVVLWLELGRLKTELSPESEVNNTRVAPGQRAVPRVQYLTYA